MKTRLFITLTLLVLAAGGCQWPSGGFPRSEAAEKTTEAQLSSGGVTRTYRLHVPIGYEAGRALPLVLNFHGSGSNALEEENLTGMSAKADAAGFLVVYPNGMDERWNDGPGPAGDADRQFIRDLIAAISSQYSVDPKRIYATGISNGGGMANRLGCDMADVIASIASDSGAYNFWEQCRPSRPVAVLAFHGLNDLLVPFDGGTPRAMLPPIIDWAAAWAERNGCGLTPSESTPAKSVTLRVWSNCQQGAGVELYALANHGHAWPGSPTMLKLITSQAVNATDLMWDFFKAHPMP